MAGRGGFRCVAVAGSGGFYFWWIPVVLGEGFFYCFVLRCFKHTM